MMLTPLLTWQDNKFSQELSKRQVKIPFWFPKQVTTIPQEFYTENLADVTSQAFHIAATTYKQGNPKENCELWNKLVFHPYKPKNVIILERKMWFFFLVVFFLLIQHCNSHSQTGLKWWSYSTFNPVDKVLNFSIERKKERLIANRFHIVYVQLNRGFPQENLPLKQALCA